MPSCYAAVASGCILARATGRGEAGLPAVDETVARLNIEHFRNKLATETDETRRQTILRLLAAEEAKLAALLNPPETRTPR